VFVAQAMAEYDNKVVDASYLRDFVGIRKQLGVDYHGVGVAENHSSYF
jgi:hypothetical protein